MDRNRSAYPGASYDSYAQRTDQSTSHMLKTAYWKTKQAVIQKLGRKEDEHIVSSDSELDAKLELFRSIQKTSMDLIRVIEKYQERLCTLSQTENEMGRFLKRRSQEDKTQAGKMMIAVGKSLSFSAQQRLALRAPLTRLQHEVETFRYRAIADTLVTIQRMESMRTEYRASLLWMKNISEELDPDTYKQLDKFRTVQAQVRKTKVNFDKLKLDSMQKVDLLAASRCNLFSQVLVLYQNALLQFWEKTSRTMVAVAESFRGYQAYEFNMLKHLSDDSKKLAELSKGEDKEGDDKDVDLIGDAADELDKKLEAIFMTDYQDEANEDSALSMRPKQTTDVKLDNFGYDKSNSKHYNCASPSRPMGDQLFSCNDDPGLFTNTGGSSSSLMPGRSNNTCFNRWSSRLGMGKDRYPFSYQSTGGSMGYVPLGTEVEDDDEMLNLESDDFDVGSAAQAKNAAKGPKSENDDDFGALMGDLEETDADRAFLADLLSGDTSSGGNKPGEDSFASEWNSVFGGPLPTSPQRSLSQPSSTGHTDKKDDIDSLFADMMPSNLWDKASSQQSWDIFGQSSGGGAAAAGVMDDLDFDIIKLARESQQSAASKTAPGQAVSSASGGANKPATKGSLPPGTKKEVSSWINMFADLDPLSNPDAISKKEGQISDA